MLHYSHIKEGDEYFKKKRFQSAIILYRSADEFKNNMGNVNLRIALASTYECFLKNKNCGHAAYKIENLYQKDSANTSVIKLKELLFKSYKIHNPSDSSIVTTRWRKEDRYFDQFFGR